MLKFGCILVYLKYYTLNLMPLMVYPKVLFGVDIHINTYSNSSLNPRFSI